MSKSLVTVGTDGFRDYVEISDGRTLNLGSVSVLKLVATLVKSPALCRLALDTFLREGRATIQADISQLEELLKPKRARWAGKDLISTDIREGRTVKATARDVSIVSQKLSALIKAFNQLSENPSPETLEGMKMASSNFRELVVAGVDSGLKHELLEFLENDTGMLRAKKSVIRSILKRPKYDHNFAKREWAKWVDDAVDEYSKEYDEDGKSLFPNALRDDLVEDLARKEEKLIEEGEYAHIKTASEESMEKEAAALSKSDWEKALKGDEAMLVKITKDIKTLEGGGEVQNLTLENAKKVKRDLEDVIKNKKKYLNSFKEASLVNEGLIHLVAAKTSEAFDIVHASEKKGTEIAKKDLHVISTKLDGIVKSASLESPELREELIHLAQKADQVRSYFEG